MTDQLPFLPSKDTQQYDAEVPALIWDANSNLRVNNIDFRLSHDTSELKRESSTAESFILGKPRHMVERAVSIAARRRVSNIFEIGILHGGSVVLYDLVFSPTRMVAIDHVPEPVKVLDDYIARHDKAEVIRPYYGVSQSDRTAMEGLLSAEFPQRDIDLIIDDASHYYDETRAAFNICFPFLSPGGLYLIEDWAWAHWNGDYWQGKDSFFAGKTALSNLLIELFMLSASRPDLIENLFIDHNMLVVCKGDGTMPQSRFNIGDHYLLRGKKLEPWL